MLIIMKETRRGSNDGHIVKQFHRGKIYDTQSNVDDYISHRLACEFIKNQYARIMEDTEYSVLEKVNSKIIEMFGGCHD